MAKHMKSAASAEKVLSRRIIEDDIQRRTARRINTNFKRSVIKILEHVLAVELRVQAPWAKNRTATVPET